MVDYVIILSLQVVDLVLLRHPVVFTLHQVVEVLVD